MIFDSRFFDFIDSHAADDPLRLRLKFHGSEPWTDYAINHIEMLPKAIRKFGETNVPRVMPLPLSVEQSTAWPIAVFNASIAGCHKSLLDMTTGLGMDLRAIAASCPETEFTACEMNPVAAEALRVNFADNSRVTVVAGDSVEYLHGCDRDFGCIFIDPARRGDTGQRVYNLHDCAPDITEILPLMLGHTGQVVAKLSPMLDITQTLRDLPGCTYLAAVDDGTECKELLAVIHAGTADRTEAEVVSRDTRFRFTPEDERNLPSPDEADKISAGMWLFEPSAAMMKAAPWRSLSARCPQIGKIAPNTHLFVADAPVEGIPGRWLEIAEVMEFSSGNIRRFARRYPHTEISTRNFNIPAEKLRKKLNVKPGGGYRTFAVTDGAKRQILLICRN